MDQEPRSDPPCIVELDYRHLAQDILANRDFLRSISFYVFDSLWMNFTIFLCT
jgi:hypothetical protein